ncbi:MAG: VWA domain-containing protein [Acidobacteria bacterium]|nr:VWA domain-containing protein [Acidobacteriota bacterium]
MSRPFFRLVGLIPTSLAAALALSSLCWIARAQNTSTEKAADQNPTLRLESNLVVLRVVVRDARGVPVVGLKRDDFKLFDEGKEQSISQFEEEPTSNASTTQGQSSSPTQARPLRFIAFYFDTLNSTEAELMQARDATDRYLAGSLQSSDRVALFSADKVLADFTADSAKLRAGLMELHAGNAGRDGQNQCPVISDYQAQQLTESDDPQSEAWRAAWEQGKACPIKAFSPSSFSADTPDQTFMAAIRMRAQMIVNQSRQRVRAGLHQFEQVVDFATRAPGERSVVLVSPGFLSQNEQASIDRIIDRALHAGVVINTLDPKGLAGLMSFSSGAQSIASPASPHAMRSKSSLDRSGELSNAEVLSELAQGTGGRFFHNNNDLSAGFKALEEDAPHYILAFSPRNVRLDGKFHTLKVSFAEKRKGYEIQSRRGYFAVPGHHEEKDVPADSQKVVETPTPQPQAPLVNSANNTKRPEPSGGPGTAIAKVQPPAATDIKGSAAPADVSRSAAVRLHMGMNHLTVDQLQTLVAAASGKSDADFAKRLANIEVTERISLSQITRMSATLPGERSRVAFSMLADAAAFLKTPAPGTPLPPVPKVEEQIHLLNSAANYVVNAMSKLPNFLAERRATIFADSPAEQRNGVAFVYEPMHSVRQSKATVLFRDGKETLEGGKDIDPESVEEGLKTRGEFGPILGTVFADASKSSLTWSHWEHGDSGPISVYRYAVPRNKSHYQFEFCCIGGGSSTGSFRQISGYHGEIFIDPANGEVARITLQADLQSAYPMVRADMMVEYGHVEIGGKIYNCPLHSVSIAKAFTKAPPAPHSHADGADDLASFTNPNDWPQQTMINDIKFEEYHVFRSDSRILPADDQPPQ